MKKALSAFWRKATFQGDHHASGETATLVECVRPRCCSQWLITNSVSRKSSSGRAKSFGPCVTAKDQTHVKPSSEPYVSPLLLL
jgi:hypothetical protein